MEAGRSVPRVAEAARCAPLRPGASRPFPPQATIRVDSVGRGQRPVRALRSDEHRPDPERQHAGAH